MRLFEPVQFWARVNPEKLALVSLGCFVEGLNYGDLNTAVANIAGRLKTEIADGQKIGVHCNDDLLQIIVTLALSRVGASVIALSTYDDFDSQTLDAVVSDHRRAQGATKAITLDANAVRVPAVQKSPAETPLESPRWAFLDAPSLLLDQGAFEARISLRSQLKGGQPGERWLCAAEPRSELGFSTVIETLFAGGTALLSSGHYDDDIQVINLYAADHLFVASSSLRDYFRLFQQTSDDPAIRFRSAVVAGLRFDEEILSAMKKRVFTNVSVILDTPELGALAAARPLDGKPLNFWPAPGVEIAVQKQNTPPALAVRFSAYTASPATAGLKQETGWYLSPYSGVARDNGSFTLPAAKS